MKYFWYDTIVINCESKILKVCFEIIRADLLYSQRINRQYRYILDEQQNFIEFSETDIKLHIKDSLSIKGKAAFPLSMELQSLLIERGITLHTVKIIQNLYDSWVKKQCVEYGTYYDLGKGCKIYKNAK